MKEKNELRRIIIYCAAFQQIPLCHGYEVTFARPLRVFPLIIIASFLKIPRLSQSESLCMHPIYVCVKLSLRVYTVCNMYIQCLPDLTNSVLTNHPGLTKRFLTS